MAVAAAAAAERFGEFVQAVERLVALALKGYHPIAERGDEALALIVEGLGFLVR